MRLPWLGMAKVVLGLGGIGTRPTERVCARVGGFATVGGSHGSRPWVSLGRVTVGLRAMLVQSAN